MAGSYNRRDAATSDCEIFRKSMGDTRVRIGVVAPGSRIEPAAAAKVTALAEALYPDRPPEIYFHPQCFRSHGHFAGDDVERAQAFLEVANDASIDALWFARGGYGSCRIAEHVLSGLSAAAAQKIYLGYSDAGSLLAGLYKAGFTGVAHGPMPSEIDRQGRNAAVRRALAFLVDRAPDSLEPTVSPDTATAAFNLTVLSHLIGTPLQPDLAGHVLMLEEVAEQMYRIDRALFHITSNPGIRSVAGIMLGRCSAIPPNDPDFGKSEEDVAKHWCEKSGIPYLGRADIGHDGDNKIVPFGFWRGI
jgi:muramoyltetrapeptide carboxypeptidase